MSLYTIYPAVTTNLNSAPQPILLRRERDESLAAYANRVNNHPASSNLLQFLTDETIPPSNDAPVETQQAV